MGTRRDEQLEQPAGAKQIEVFRVQVRGIAKPFATLAAALPSVFNPSKPALIERCRSQCPITRVQDAGVNEQEGDKGEEWNQQPRQARAPDNNRDPQTGEDQREAGRRQPSVQALEPITLGSPRGQSRTISRVYGRTFPSAFHR
jgi:hypothetical protein